MESNTFIIFNLNYKSIWNQSEIDLINRLHISCFDNNYQTSLVLTFNILSNWSTKMFVVLSTLDFRAHQWRRSLSTQHEAAIVTLVTWMDQMDVFSKPIKQNWNLFFRNKFFNMLILHSLRKFSLKYLYYVKVEIWFSRRHLTLRLEFKIAVLIRSFF